MDNGLQSSTTTTYRDAYRKPTIASSSSSSRGRQSSVAAIEFDRNLTDRNKVVKDEPVSPKIVFELRADARLSSYARDFMLPSSVARKAGQRPQSPSQKKVPRTGCTTAMTVLSARMENGKVIYLISFKYIFGRAFIKMF